MGPLDGGLDERAREIVARVARGEHVDDAEVAEAVEALEPLAAAFLSAKAREQLRSMSEPEFIRAAVQASVVEQARDSGRGGQG